MNIKTRRVDMLIIGAGFAGIYQLHRAREMGLEAVVLEAGAGVGGTWFWNRYPGARCDVESLDYSYSFSKELEQEWNWTERFAPQDEILRYLNHVTDRFDLRRDMRFNARVTSATFNSEMVRWTVGAENGQYFDAQFLIMATGCLSIPQRPVFKGLDTFKGEWYHSAMWPAKPVSFKGKRVGLIGTGSSGVQMTPLIAGEAQHLTVFQRTANYSVPAQNRPMDSDTLCREKEHYAERRKRSREALTGQFLAANDKSALEVSDEERQAEFESRWEGLGGGFRMLRAFSDLLRNREANRYAASFVGAKIRETVGDAAVAALLTPKDDLPFGTKRLCVDTDYYETFNRANVSLVDVKTSPIIEITEGGVRTSQDDYALDTLVFATGFDAMTGALLNIDIRGENGISLKEKWSAGPRTYLGIAIAGFPNMFIIAGPGSPSVLSNMVHSIETHVEWISNLIADSRSKGIRRIEAVEKYEDSWVKHVNEAADETLYPIGNSWYVGANIPGKPRVFMPYVAGVPAYRAIIQRVASESYDGFTRL